MLLINIGYMFFNQEFSLQILWQNKYSLRLAMVGPKNKQHIAQGLSFMSQDSIRNRFMGSKKEFSPTELKYFTEIDGVNHYALGLQELDRYQIGVAIARLVRSQDDLTSAEVAITIIDDYQRIGLGSFLLDLIILVALEREIKQLTFSYLPQNQAISKMIQNKSLILKGISKGDYQEMAFEIKREWAQEIQDRLKKVVPSIIHFSP